MCEKKYSFYHPFYFICKHLILLIEPQIVFYVRDKIIDDAFRNRGWGLTQLHKTGL